MTTPAPSAEDRATAMEKRWDTILPTLATKEDMARLEGQMHLLREQMDAMGNRLLLRFGAVALGIGALAVAAAKFL